MSDNHATPARADPELTRQIDTAGKDGIVEAIVHLDPSQQKGTPQEFKAGVEDILGRVAKQVGHAPKSVTPFVNIRAFAVAATGPFLRLLSDQPEVRMARAS